MNASLQELLERLQRDPHDAQALDAVDAQLSERGEHGKLERVLDWFSAALLERGTDGALAASAFRRLGRLRTGELGDVDGAIVAYQGALRAQPDDAQAMHALARLLSDRARAAGDRADHARAAGLYYALAQRAQGRQVVDFAEATLDCDPTQVQALELIEQGVELPRDRMMLVRRWEAFIASSPDGGAVDRRRPRLAREYTHDGKLQEAIDCLEPLADKGMVKARAAVESLRRKLARAPLPRAPQVGALRADHDAEAKTTLRQGPGEALLMSPPSVSAKGPRPPAAASVRDFGTDPFAAPLAEDPDTARTDPMTTAAQMLDRGAAPRPGPPDEDDFPDITFEQEGTTDKVLRGPPQEPAAPLLPQPPLVAASPAPEPAPPPRIERELASPPEAAAAPGGPPAGLPPDGFEPDLYGDTDVEDDAHGGLDHVEPFSVQVIMADEEVRRARSGSRGTRPVVEVIRLSGGRVMGTELLRWPARTLRPAGVPFALRLRSRTAELRLRRSVQGLIWRSSSPPSSGPAQTPTVGRMELALDDVVELREERLTWRIRLVRPPPRPSGPPWWRGMPWKVYAACAGLATGEHLLLLGLFLGLASMGVSFRVESRPPDEVFAEIRMRDPHRPPPERLRPPRPLRRLRREHAEHPVEPPPEKVRIPRSLRRRLRQIARTREGESSADRLVNALRSPVQGQGQSLSEVVSNIEAVEGGGDSGAFRVGGTLAALEGGGVNIATGGGGDVGTLGGQSATKNLRRMEAHRGGVRGRVRGVQALARVQGSLSRGEVLAVLNRAIGRIQRCYERSLTSNPNLSGRISFAWTIRPNGAVAGVREASSTLGNPAVSTCISRVLRGLRFPHPQGGPVQVTFPFMFQRVP